MCAVTIIYAMQIVAGQPPDLSVLVAIILVSV